MMNEEQTAGRPGEPAEPGPPPGSPPEGASRADRIRQWQWKPGQSGNPGGRPKSQSITAELRALLGKEHNGKRIVERFIKEALSGKFPFAKEVIDRADGKVTDKLEVEAPSVVQVIIK